MREDFPYFLLPKKEEQLAEELNLTKEEHELLSMEILYCDDMTDRHPFHALKNLPYAFVEKYGPLQIINIHNKMTKKIEKYRNYIVQYSISNPEKVFSLGDADDADIIAFTKELLVPAPYTVGNVPKHYEAIAKSICLLERISHTEQKKLPVFATQIYNDGHSFWQAIGDGEQYAHRNNLSFNVVPSTKD
jgi:hypothetical protein